MNISVLIKRKENADYFSCAVGDAARVELEDYVAAVVASEIGNSALEACKAQAVAARTFAVGRGVLNGKAISDLSTEAQAYRAARNDAKSYPNAKKAAEETAGKIMTYHGKAISAVYSASNGGRTVSAEERWGGKRVYLIAKNDPWDAASGQGKSGHGVGMSQRGAKYAAKIGVPYEEILRFYYPETVIQNISGEEKKPMDGKEKAVVDAAESQIGNPYVFGAWGAFCTPALRKKYANLNPVHAKNIFKACPVLSGKQGSCAGCKWQNRLAFDCRGFTFWALKQVGITLKGAGATSQYKNDANWEKKGPIAEMPNRVCCVFKDRNGVKQHTGLHVGDGRVIHCSHNVERGTIQSTRMTHYAVPKGLNGGETEEKPMSKSTIRSGSGGAAVEELQKKLNALGFDCGSVDGKFGKKTLEAVKAFQTANGLNPDGIVGNATWAALMKAENTESPKAEEHAEDGAESRIRKAYHALGVALGFEKE